MSLGNLLKAVAVVYVLMSLGASPARAEVWMNVDCNCDPKTQSVSVSGLLADGSTVFGCPCLQYHTLGRLASMEFRFRCKHPNASPEHDTWFARVTQRDKPTTCTSVFDTYGTDYLSKSCTNWSTLSTDTVGLGIICQPK